MKFLIQTPSFVNFNESISNIYFLMWRSKFDNPTNSIAEALPTMKGTKVFLYGTEKNCYFLLSFYSSTFSKALLTGPHHRKLHFFFKWKSVSWSKVPKILCTANIYDRLHWEYNNELGMNLNWLLVKHIVETDLSFWLSLGMLYSKSLKGLRIA